MPIRFRCPHCSQLMGIARRKAGSRVQCTSCAREVLVPLTDDSRTSNAVPAPAASTGPGKGSGADPFESDDLAALLQTPRSRGGPSANMEATAMAPPEATSPPWSTKEPIADRDESTLSARKRPDATVGLVLSPMQATVLTVVLILSLAFSFLIGLLIGRFAL